ncbi:class F sortase [Streptomyces sp. V4-01]|uniref:Class F sortase n=1 Tax=Actinacidiphila polyblastidii TaxID=3110430 RepID=A0ABU7P8I2_9ACTN|nr:class F sortase [Streptomyces sp. V4-01]
MSVQPPHPGASQGGGASGRDPRTRVLRWAAGAALLGGLLVYNSFNPTGSQPAVGAPAAPAPATAGASAQASASAAASARAAQGPVLSRAVPVRLSIPSIGVNAPFTPLSLGSDGRLQPPPEDDVNLAGYYADGPMPGERGSAIVAGHVDTKTGPAVFLLLSLLKKGATADITRVDGVTATFRVDSVETFAKNDFPDDRVYGDTPDAELRIITCGGTFDHAKQDYKDNVVVFAHLESSRQD